MNYPTSNLDKIVWESHIDGIPCFIRVDSFIRGRADYIGRTPEESEEGYGDEIAFTVLDSRHIIAPWLERQLTGRDTDRIIEEFHVTLLEIKHCYED